MKEKYGFGKYNTKLGDIGILNDKNWLFRAVWNFRKKTHISELDHSYDVDWKVWDNSLHAVLLWNIVEFSSYVYYRILKAIDCDGHQLNDSAHLEN